MMNVRASLLLLALPALCTLALRSNIVRAAEDEDPTEAAVSVVQLEPVAQPVDVIAPVSLFRVPNGEEIWARAWARVSTPSPEQGSGFFALGDLLGAGFKAAKNLRAEKFSPDDTGADLQVVVSANEASQEEQGVVLKHMKLVFYMGDPTVAKAKADAARAEAAKAEAAKPAVPQTDPSKKETGAPKSGTAAGTSKDKPGAKKASANQSVDAAQAAARTSFMPMGGRVEITAPDAVLNTTTNEGCATGEVKIEIYQKGKPGDVERPMSVLSTNRLRWRTWSEPTIGSMELAMYTAREKGEAQDPLVLGYYEVAQPGEAPSTMRIQGRGMIFESGTLDHLAPIYDDDGRLAGGSRIARNRALFRTDINIEMTAATLSSLMPFQAQPPEVPAKGKAPAVKKDDKPPVPPSLTLVQCSGPAILDTAVVPYKKRDPNANLAQPVETALDKEQLQAVLLARRFEFLNNVTLTRTPLDANGKRIPDSAENETHMSCGHLRIQLPAMQAPGTTQTAEYIEAIQGVKMKGRNTAGQVSGVGAPGPAQEFSMECERMYFDGPTDSMFLVGTPKVPSHALNPQFEAFAQQFSYQMKTQDFAMPVKGPKRLVIRATPPPPEGAPAAPGAAVAKPDDKTAKPAASDSMLSFTQGDTIITWTGSLLRQLVRLPVPGGADRVKEVLNFNENVSIEQPTGSLTMKAGRVKVVRPSPEGAVEYLEGVSNVGVKMGDQTIAGEKVTVEMIPGATPEAPMEKDFITISGNHRKQTLATLIKGGSAARAEKFLIDRKNDTFLALGGTVAVVKREGGDAPPADAPKPQAAQDAGGIFQGITLQPGGNLFIQSDGDFSKNGAANTIHVKKNVIVRQPGLQMFADELEMLMDTPPVPGSPEALAAAAAAAAKGGPSGTGKTPTNPKDAVAAPNAPAAPGALGGELFTADPQKISCYGNIELITDTQWVQCDELVYDVKTQVSVLKMKDPNNDVRIYMQDEGGGTRVLCVRGSLVADGASGKFLPGGITYMLPYSKPLPTGRAKEQSPVQKPVERKVQK